MKYLLQKVVLSVITCLFVVPPVFARNDTIQLTRSFGLQISGFARADYFLDTRQTSEAVEGMITFYPARKVLDANNKDINAAPKANISSVSTRLGTRFFAPDILGARSSAYVEVDFTGNSNTNGIRLRHASVNLAWTDVNLLFGRAWHPLSSTCVPNVLALNTGAPFWAFNRSDQVRVDYTPGNWSLSAIAAYQNDYASLGPDGKSGNYQRNAFWPEFGIDISYKTPDFQTGIVGVAKTLKPYLETYGTEGIHKTDATLTTYAAQAYMQYQSSKWLIKVQSMYTQNTSESLMLGGYAVSSYDIQTGHMEYTPTQHMTYWLGIDYGKKWQTGLFAGYLNSLGTLDNVSGIWYAREPDIKYMYRISPHVFYNINNWQFALEFEYTAAAYGRIDYSDHAKVTDAEEVANFRTNLSVKFSF